MHSRLTLAKHAFAFCSKSTVGIVFIIKDFIIFPLLMFCDDFIASADPSYRVNKIYNAVCYLVQQRQYIPHIRQYIPQKMPSWKVWWRLTPKNCTDEIEKLSFGHIMNIFDIVQNIYMCSVYHGQWFVPLGHQDTQYNLEWPLGPRVTHWW